MQRRDGSVASSGEFEMGYERGNSKINVNVENHENSVFSDPPYPTFRNLRTNFFFLPGGLMCPLMS